MEALIKKELGTSTLKAFGAGGGGCISNGQSYITDNAKIFVKINSKSGARLMFDGESASLAAIDATNTIRVPQAIKVLDSPDGRGAMFIMEHLDIHHLNTHETQLGEQLAKLHLHNASLEGSTEGSLVGKSSSPVQFVSEFGFHTTTCCGYIPQDNTRLSDWPTFFMRKKLLQQLDLAEKEYGDREAMSLWPELQRKIPALFKDLDIKPSLLHGDLWGGNVGETKEGPVIFDPASFYGHHEFDLGIASMFGGFGSEFYTAYHAVIPKVSGFATRQKLYQLFHYLNHWNHFGGGYRDSSIRLMKQLIKS